MNESDDRTVRQRLIDAASQHFLNDDYHRVTTRQIAAVADVNVSMIRYYFGNKEGLYEEMIRTTLQPLIDVLESSLLSSTDDFTDYFHIYYRTMRDNPRFPALVLKILALNQGPGKRFIHQLLERGRQRGQEKIELLKKRGLIGVEIDPDAVRIAFVSLAMMPMLLKPVLEEQMEKQMDETFFRKLASLNGQLFRNGLLPPKDI
ncbi:MAG: TetR/AcrR family transcriptional regulator [Candidatus Thiodiazotropha sp.]